KLVTGVQTCALPIYAPRWLDALVRGAVAGVPESGQYAAVIQRLDQVFHTLADEAEEPERRMLAGRISSTDFGITARRRVAEAKRSEERRVGKEGRAR